MSLFTNNDQLQGIILAAGTSSRFKTGRTKLVEKICGREMILYATDVLVKLNIPIYMVVGFQRDLVEEVVKEHFLKKVTFIHQEEQNGTGHAIHCTQDTWTAENILIMNGDMPLVTTDIIEKLYKKHTDNNATITFATAHHCDPEGMYGRVIQGTDSIEIIEAQDFQGDITETCCVNAGIYIIKKDFLKKAIQTLSNNNNAQEWYITDLIKKAADQKEKVLTLSVPFDRIRGVNNFKELWAVEQIKKSEIIQYWMGNGVRFAIAHNVHIDWNVVIGTGTFIGSGVQLLKGTHVGKDCNVNAFSLITASTIKDRTTVREHTVIENSTLETEVCVGPFSYIHGKSTLESKTVIGSFVEINRSSIGAGTKAKHLSYLGDTHTEEKVTIGAGTIVCNYDGTRKHATKIKNGVFLGGNTTIIAPVTIGNDSIIAAGSTITEDVPANALAIGRSRQHNKEDYANKIREKQKKSGTEKFFVAATSKTSFDELQ
jgi:bifunctional UDP-N-acetylglucosamine pyrophosphorylase/glucosamine-1-phosphate N-acetyltransferase